MGILKRNVSAKSAQSAITIIAEGNKFCGDMSIIGKMHIDGIFEGNVSSLDNISIGKTGHVRGLIKARAVDVCGLVESKKMSIHPQGCFLGERRLKEVSALNDDKKKIETGMEAIDSLPDKVVLDSKSES